MTSVSFSPSGEILAAGFESGWLQLWRISNGITRLRSLKHHTNSVNSIAFSPDGTLLASATGNNTVQLWRVPDGSLLSTLEGYAMEHELVEVTRVAFSPDGNLMASVSSKVVVDFAGCNSVIQVWSTAEKILLRTFEGHAGQVTSIAFSPDGAILATAGSNDSTLWLWNLRSR